MTENESPNNESCPCMGLLSLRVLIRMWNSVPLEDCTVAKKEVSRCLESLIQDYPGGGEKLLNKVVELSDDKQESCDKEEADTWSYVSGLMSQRLDKMK